jgi:hypothetical protein
MAVIPVTYYHVRRRERKRRLTRRAVAADLNLFAMSDSDLLTRSV